MLAKPAARDSVGYIAAVSTLDELVDWGPQPESLQGDSHSSGQLLYRTSDRQVESGLWVCTPGRWRLSLPGDELCHFLAGCASYYQDDGQVTEVRPGSVVLFPAGWHGECEVHETIRNTYMLSMIEPEAGQNTEARLLGFPLPADKVVDWGPVATMVEGNSRTSGVMLYRRSDGCSEAGVWQCTPGWWNCHVTSDEYCHFLDGHCTYLHESGEVIDIAPDTLAFFPRGWRGTCHITETIRKVYMIRGAIR